MKQYKVLQNFIKKENGERVVYDFNYEWTIWKEQLQLDIEKIKEDIKEVTFANGYHVQYDEKEPYTIVEREVSGFEIQGECKYVVDYEDASLYVGKEDLIGKIGKNLNGVKIKVTIEVLE